MFGIEGRQGKRMGILFSSFASAAGLGLFVDDGLGGFFWTGLVFDGGGVLGFVFGGTFCVDGRPFCS